MAYENMGEIYIPCSKEKKSMLDTLPVGVYNTKFCGKVGFYLEKVKSFTSPSVIYGNVGKTVDRIYSTFLSRPGGTGLSLAGEKGSGKTLLAKLLSLKGEANGVSTVLVSERFCGPEFNEFIQNISEPTIVIFDEFEKVYSIKLQKKLLTLFDGVYSSKKLFILTCNDSNRIQNALINRPGRVYYSLSFHGLDEAFIRDYCVRNLKDKTQAASILKFSAVFKHFNFDMLQAIIEEMNRYDQTVSEVLEFLNVRLDSMYDNYIVKVYQDGKDLVTEGREYSEWSGNLFGSKGINTYLSNPGRYIKFTTKDFVEETAEGFIFEKPDLKLRAVFVRDEKSTKFDLKWAL